MMFPVADINPAVVMLPPEIFAVTLKLDTTLPLRLRPAAFMLPPVMLPTATIVVPAAMPKLTLRLDVTLPLRLIDPADIALVAIMLLPKILPVPDTVPDPYAILPPEMLPVTLTNWVLTSSCTTLLVSL